MTDDSVLRERDLLRTLIDALPDLIYVKDDRSRFLVANAAVARVMGTTVDNLLGKSDLDFFPEELARGYRADEAAVIGTGAPLLNRQEEVVEADGSRREFLTTKMPLFDQQGRTVGIIGIGHDITALARAQDEARRAADAAAQANMAKSNFLSNMSHEIRTPVNGIIGMTEMLLDSELDAMQIDCAETVRDCSRALLSVINDILDFSKIEAGKLEFERIDMRLRDLMRDVGRILAFQAHAKGLELIVDVDPAIPERLNADPGRLRQILLNLGNNAIKFTAAGEVTLHARALASDASGLTVQFEVRDTGIGIPEDRLEALFKPFSQVDASTTRRFGGTGLGLSIVHKLVELMRGQVGVETEVGAGSRFWFTLHLDAATAPDLAAQQLTSTKLAGRRILIVDDNTTNLKVLKSQLEHCNVIAELACGAEEAWARLEAADKEARPFDIALLDHDMPGCDGAELGERINAHAEFKRTRLVLLTSSGRGDASQFADRGFAGYLTKPVAANDLLRCLGLVLAGGAVDWHSGGKSIITQNQLTVVDGRTARKRVLLAEDNIVNQKIACRLLEKLGYDFEVARDGREAVGKWECGHYDAILMDCQMPDMDGYEATREIRRRESPGDRIPIVALTAHAMKGADLECQAAGMDDYLTKPVDRAQLATCLERHL